MRYIWHVALGSGEASREPCGYPAEHLTAWRGHSRAAIDSKAGESIPGQQGYAMTARAFGGVLLCTVGRIDNKVPLVTFCVVTRAQQARKAWQALHEGYPQFAASRDRVPQAPYCAVRAEAGLMSDLAAADWLDAYQIAIAWAWLDKCD